MEVWVRFVEVWFRVAFELGAPETAPTPGQAHTQSGVQDLENPWRLRSLEATHASRRNRRKQDFHGGSEYARRSAVGAATQFHHELNHGETGKGDPLWGLNTALPVWPIHGGFGGHFMVVLVRFTVFWIHGGLGAWGARNSVPPWTDTHTHTLAAGIDRTRKTKVFWEKVSYSN